MGIRNICVATDSRAESEILYWLMKEIQNDPDLKLHTLVMGAHLSPEFGMTEKQLIKNGFPVSKRIITTLSSDEPAAICKSAGLALLSIPDALVELKPDWLIILGDRYEMLATAFCAYTLRIPIAHLHGGESTFGAIDEALRHSITKMSSLHFVSNQEHQKRVVQLGENPKSVFNFGAPGIDHCYRTPLLSREELSKEINFDINNQTPTAIVTYHPVTLGNSDSSLEIDQIISAIEKSGINAIFTKSNADAHGRIINSKIEQFCMKNSSKYIFIESLGSIKYLSSLKNLSLMIGNTSSGIIESSSFGIPVVNIGDRQKGRVQGQNVLNVVCEQEDILKAINQALSSSFQKLCKGSKNPYEGPEKGQSSLLIKEKIKATILSDKDKEKVFFDLN